MRSAKFLYKCVLMCTSFLWKGGMDMPVKGKLRGKLGKAKEALMEYAYLITLGAVVAVIAASAMYTSRVRTQFETQVEAAAGAPEIAATPSPSPETEITPLPTIAPLVVGTLGMGAGRVWPVSGEVIRGYAPDEPVFWETLSCYQAHRGVDIGAKAGEEILCVMDGVVEEITRDELWGYSVSVVQTDGSVARYAGIGFCPLWEGMTITRGQTVGEVMAAIPCEAELGAHLHLEYVKEGQGTDPTLLLQNAKRK